jgi:hypothetical protein
MQKIPVIAIFDIGKTNKKLFLLAENYQIVWGKNTQLPETTDDDEDNCEDISLLTNWLSDTYAEVLNQLKFIIPNKNHQISNPYNKENHHISLLTRLFFPEFKNYNYLIIHQNIAEIRKNGVC